VNRDVDNIVFGFFEVWGDGGKKLFLQPGEKQPTRNTEPG
jgi:hypothetical protein